MGTEAPIASPALPFWSELSLCTLLAPCRWGKSSTITAMKRVTTLLPMRDRQLLQHGPPLFARPLVNLKP